MAMLGNTLRMKYMIDLAPVGSNHQRIIPERELPKLSEREKFWNDEQSR